MLTRFSLGRTISSLPHKFVCSISRLPVSHCPVKISHLSFNNFPIAHIRGFVPLCGFTHKPSATNEKVDFAPISVHIPKSTSQDERLSFVQCVLSVLVLFAFA